MELPTLFAVRHLIFRTQMKILYIIDRYSVLDGSTKPFEHDNIVFYFTHNFFFTSRTTVIHDEHHNGLHIGQVSLLN